MCGGEGRVVRRWSEINEVVQLWHVAFCNLQGVSCII